MCFSCSAGVKSPPPSFWVIGITTKPTCNCPAGRPCVWAAFRFGFQIHSRKVDIIFFQLARGNAHGASAAGASAQPLPVYPDRRAQVSDDLVATARVARHHDGHAARGGAHAARLTRSNSSIHIADEGPHDEEDEIASDGDAKSDDSDADAAVNDRDVYTLPLHVLGCCISAVDVPRGGFMHLEPGSANDTSASAGTAAAHGRPKRRRV